MTPEQDAMAVVLGALEGLGVPYVIGGSYASSVHGVPRSTNDMDITAALKPSDCERLADALGEDFYLDPGVARDAMARGGSFNIIHQLTGQKVDVFPAGRDAFRLGLLRRRVERVLGGRTYPFVTAEDIILLKLAWYREGGEVSDRQWRDVAEVLVAQAGALDGDYLAGEADRMGLSDLLDRVLAEAMPPTDGSR